MIFNELELHSRGAAQFTSDTPGYEQLLAVYPVVSSIAHGRITKLELTLALQSTGVVAIFTAADIPGCNRIGNFSADEVLLAVEEVLYQGQPIALIVAETVALARQAAALVSIDYEPLPAVFDARSAERAGLLIGPKRLFSIGEVEAVWPACELIVTGSASTGGQEHMYLETQTAIAYPLENQALKVVAATQSPGFVQRIIAQVLAIAMHAIEVEVLRLGGGFGGKEEQATVFAVMAALAAQLLQRPVKIELSREEDCRLTGKRHPYTADFKMGLDGTGKILAYQVAFYQNAGAWADLSPAILERTLFHAGNSYFIPNMQVSAVSCQTHLPPNTAFRGFGAPQAMFVLECAFFKAARALGVAPEQIQQRNLLTEDGYFYYGMPAKQCQAVRCWQTAHARFAWPQRQQDIAAFNAANVLQKKGFALMPICFGIAFTATFLNQADALVHIYSDGSIGISCGAVEMGQGVNRKLARIAAMVFGVDVERIHIESTNTLRIANMSPTAASTGADLNGQAVRLACEQVKQTLLAVAATHLGVTQMAELELVQERVVWQTQTTELTWKQLVNLAYLSRSALSAAAHYATPGLFFDRTREQGTPFAYHVYGCAAVEVTLDCLRGRYHVDRITLVHDAGSVMDQKIDRGQIEGAVLQGLGWMTMEEVVYDEQGALLTDNLSRYKIPGIYDAPDIEIHFLDATLTSSGVMPSKAIGEPPLMYGIGAYFALCQAINAFNPDWQADFCAPLTTEKVLLALYDAPQ